MSASSDQSTSPDLTKASLGITPGLPLEVRGNDPQSLRDGLQHLMDIEAIKRLKHAYFRCIDTANFDELAELFHEDVSVHFVGGSYEWKLNGRQEYLDAVRNSFHTESIGHHNGHHPEIEILSATEATAIWYLADQMWIFEPGFFTTGTALYWDRCVKVDGRWLIRETRYRRIYELNQPLKEKPPLSTHYLGTHGTPFKGGD
ncbi:nuclear transport factor 2 family protein [Myxococcota bacterium]|nr:nuclear transport factor 2 family protein [Myxococcota bacterium]